MCWPRFPRNHGRAGTPRADSDTKYGGGSFGSRIVLSLREKLMRRMRLTIAALTAIVLASAFFAGHAHAMTNPLPAGLAHAVHDVNAAEQIAYVCRRRCSWRGCFRRCSQTGPVVVYRTHRRWRAW